MPELPEVQTVVNDLVAAGVVGATIRDLQVSWARSIHEITPEQLRSRLQGRSIGGVWRRGKYVVIDLNPQGHLLIHLRMSGKLQVTAQDAACAPHERAKLSLDCGRVIRFVDPRKFGRWYWADNAGQFLTHLGPEPLARRFSAKLLAQRLQGLKRQLKPLLLDQHFIAGLGNIYVDESLWQAQIHPLRGSHTLAAAEIIALHRAIRRVLRRAIVNAGTTLGGGPSNFRSVDNRQGRNGRHLAVFRRTGRPCPRCGTPIQRLVVGQRATHICPRCQPTS